MEIIANYGIVKVDSNYYHPYHEIGGDVSDNACYSSVITMVVVVVIVVVDDNKYQRN